MWAARAIAVCLSVLAGNPTTHETARDRVQFRLLARANDPAGEVVPFAEPHDGETELRLVRTPALDGSHVASAKAQADRARGGWLVSVEFTETGSERLREVTSANIDQTLAIVVDGVIVTAPTIRTPITRLVEIDGGFDRERAEALAAAINDAASRGATTRPAR